MDGSDKNNKNISGQLQLIIILIIIGADLMQCNVTNDVYTNCPILLHSMRLQWNGVWLQLKLSLCRSTQRVYIVMLLPAKYITSADNRERYFISE